MSERGADRLLERWRAAGLIDDATAARIRAWEAGHPAEAGERRLSRFAFGFGGLLLGAGVLLFVAANWDQLSPVGRFALLTAIVAALHVSGALVRPRLPALATTLHAVGTAALGGGIFLAGQVFNLAEHWPEGFLLWSVGALAGVALLRDWPQAVWLALLAPAWLVSEWVASDLFDAMPFSALVAGVLLLALAYTAAVGPGREAAWRRAVAILGAVVLVPLAIALPLEFDEAGLTTDLSEPPHLAVWVVALGVPLLVGAWLRGRAAWPLLLATLVVVAIVALDSRAHGQLVMVHLLYAALAVGLVWWGVRERHRLRVNLGVLAFALNVLVFYYSSLLDRLGRALGLIGLGVLFVGGGWLLERVRRRLVQQAGVRS